MKRKSCVALDQQLPHKREEKDQGFSAKTETTEVKRKLCVGDFLDWIDKPAPRIFKANQYFDFYRIPIPQRLLMASYHMNSEALVWYQDTVDGGHL